MRGDAGIRVGLRQYDRAATPDGRFDATPCG
jgi:hypothetical protein